MFSSLTHRDKCNTQFKYISNHLSLFYKVSLSCNRKMLGSSLRSKFYKLSKYVRTCHCAHLSLGSLLAVYLCISATIRSLWFPNSFFSALSRATSEALGPLLFSANCTVFREDSICWKDTRYILITFTILVPHQYSSLWSILTGS